MATQSIVSAVISAAAGLALGGAMSASAQTSLPPPALEFIVLGSGGPGATGRAASSYVVLLDGTPRLLVDAGPGSFVRLGEAQISLQNLDIVLLTHVHIDHVGELPGVFKARAVSAAGPVIFDVWGPSGSAASKRDAYFPSTRQFMDLLFGEHGAYAYLKDFSAPLSIHAHDIPAPAPLDEKPRTIYQEAKLQISAVAGHHRDSPAVIYRIDYAGKSITFSGDIDAQGLAGLRALAQGSDWLIFNTVVLDPPQSPPILYTLHTPPLTIGQIAEQQGVHNLLLSHLSPATERNHAQVLASIRVNYPGPVQMATDGMRIVP